MGVIEPIRSHHLIDAFDCGEEQMNRWLQDSALDADKRNTARTFVLCEGRKVIAYYALSAGSVISSRLPSEFGDMPKHPIPVFLLARLAVDVSVQGRGYGRALVKDAVVRSLAANREVAGVALMVETLNEKVKTFYGSLGFLESTLSARRMFFQLIMNS